MIKLVLAFEFLTVAIGMILIVTQIAIPVAFNTKMFPLFRKRARETENEMAQLNEDTEIANRKRQIEEVKERLGVILDEKPKTRNEGTPYHG